MVDREKQMIIEQHNPADAVNRAADLIRWAS
jgi:hypothetical protein